VPDDRPTAVLVDPRADRDREPEPGHDLTVGDLLRRVYQVFYSKTVGLLLILALTVLALAGVLIGQAPAGTYDDEAARAAFVERAAGTFGGWAGVLDALGLFRVFSSPLLLVVVALLALSIVACTTHRVPLLWRRYRHPRTRAGAAFFDRARHRADLPADLPADRAAAVVRDRLRARRHRVLVDPGDPRALYADQYAWGGVGTVAAHISFLMILGAFVLSAHAGIDDALTIPVGGDPVEVGHGTGLRVAAKSFAARYDDDGRPLDYVSHLVVEDADGGSAAQDVRVNQPLRHGGVRFHQATFGVAADVRVTGPGGEVLHAGSVPLVWTSQDGTAAVGSVPLPGLGADLEVFAPASGATGADLAAGQAAFRLVRTSDSAVTAAATAEQGEPVALGDVTAVFEREREYTGIAVRRDPGAVWMWIGSALLIGGSTVTFACRHRRVWIRVEEGPGRVRLASSDERDAASERWFAGLAQDLEAALDRAATDEGRTAP